MEFDVKYFVTFSGAGRFTADTKKELRSQVEEYVCSKLDKLFSEFELEEVSTEILEELPF